MQNQKFQKALIILKFLLIFNNYSLNIFCLFYNIFYMQLGVFLNNTNSDVNFEINLHNYNILKQKFKKIIIIDSENDFSQKLKDTIYTNNNETNIINYVLDNIYLKDNMHDFNISNILFAFNIVNKFNEDNIYHITFINDNYIYCSDLNEYFNYINTHDLDLCSYTDSTENIYHYQFYLFTIKITNLNKCINFINNEEINKYKNIETKILSIFDKKMPFLKIAYLNDNYNSNIFYNTALYDDLLNNKMLPILNINRLYSIKNNFNGGKKYILNIHIREILQKYNLLHLFDVPDNFNIVKYKENYPDLHHLDDRGLIIHWINYGKNEKRIIE